METPVKYIVRIILAFLLGLLVLILSGFLYQFIAVESGLLDDLQWIKHLLNHLLMLVFSVLLIGVINSGKLSGYGFTWNMDFPFVKVLLISVFFGIFSSIISMVFQDGEIDFPGSDFSLFEQIIYIWIWASICEEVLTRGLIQGFLFPLKHLGIRLLGRFISLPVMFGAVFFGLMHLMLLSLGIPLFFVLNIIAFATLLGIIAGYYREQTNSLVPAILVHGCFNIGGSIMEILG
jgi:membrane protease YdiL (CAAX protease family)